MGGDTTPGTSGLFSNATKAAFGAAQPLNPIMHPGDRTFSNHSGGLLQQRNTQNALNKYEVPKEETFEERLARIKRKNLVKPSAGGRPPSGKLRPVDNNALSANSRQVMHAAPLRQNSEVQAMQKLRGSQNFDNNSNS